MAFTPSSTLSLSLRIVVWHQNTFHTARLLDPCFKTGWREENFKRASSFDWWAPHSQLNNQRTINCPPTSNHLAHPEHRLKLHSSARANSFEAPREQDTVCTSPAEPFLLLQYALPFFAPAQWTMPTLLLLPFCSLYAISGSFNLPFGILFNFPSQYFSSIGLHVIFRFRRNLPPALRWNHNQRDSKRSGDLARAGTDKGVSPSMLQLSNWLSVPLLTPNHFLERSIGLVSVLSPNPFPLICTFFVRHY